MKAKQSALKARNPWSAVGNPTSALSPSSSSFGSSGLAPIGIHHLLLSNLTTGLSQSLSEVEASSRIVDDKYDLSLCESDQLISRCVSYVLVIITLFLLF